MDNAVIFLLNAKPDDIDWGEWVKYIIELSRGSMNYPQTPVNSFEQQVNVDTDSEGTGYVYGLWSDIRYHKVPDNSFTGDALDHVVGRTSFTKSYLEQREDRKWKQVILREIKQLKNFLVKERQYEGGAYARDIESKLLKYINKQQ